MSTCFSQGAQKRFGPDLAGSRIQPIEAKATKPGEGEFSSLGNRMLRYQLQIMGGTRPSGRGGWNEISRLHEQESEA